MSETAHILNMSRAVLIQCRMVIFGSLHSTNYKTTVSGIYSKYVSRGTRWQKKEMVEREKRESGNLKCTMVTASGGSSGSGSSRDP